jgi:probable HAF family extracellular repeat protein
MSEVGEIVGSSKYPIPSGNPRHAFLWKKGVMTDLGTLYPKCDSMVTGSTAYGATSKTQIVGSSWCDNTAAAAFLWEKDRPMVDLNTLIPANLGIQLVLGFGINDRGEISGVGVLPNGDSHAFLLVPCDENHSDGECEDEGEGAVVGRGETNQRPNVVLPENVRRMLRQRLGSRYHIPGVGTPKN